jgi:hypothetical protein
MSIKEEKEPLTGREGEQRAIEHGSGRRKWEGKGSNLSGVMEWRGPDGVTCIGFVVAAHETVQFEEVTGKGDAVGFERARVRRRFAAR